MRSGPNIFFNYAIQKYQNEKNINDQNNIGDNIDDFSDFLNEESDKLKNNKNYFHEPVNITDKAMLFLKSFQKRKVIYYSTLNDQSKTHFYKICSQFIQGKKRKKYDSNIKLGVFSKIELVLLKFAVSLFTIKFKKKFEDLINDLTKFEYSDDFKDLVQFVCTFLTFRGYETTRFTIYYYFNIYKNDRLEDEEKILLLSLQNIYGNKLQYFSLELKKSVHTLSKFLEVHEDKKRLNTYNEDEILKIYQDNQSLTRIARLLNVKMHILRRILKKHCRKIVINDWNCKFDFYIAIFVMKFNFFCPMEKINGLIDLLDNLTNKYKERLKDVKNKMHKKTNDKNSFKIKVSLNNDDKNIDPKEKNIDDKENNNIIPDETEYYENSKIIEIKNSMRYEIDILLKNIKKSIKNYLHTTLNLKIKIKKDDIFFSSIQKKLNSFFKTDCHFIESKFFILKDLHCIKTYYDLKKWIKKTAFEIILKDLRVEMEK